MVSGTWHLDATRYLEVSDRMDLLGDMTGMKCDTITFAVRLYLRDAAYALGWCCLVEVVQDTMWLGRVPHHGSIVNGQDTCRPIAGRRTRKPATGPPHPEDVVPRPRVSTSVDRLADAAPVISRRQGDPRGVNEASVSNETDPRQEQKERSCERRHDMRRVRRDGARAQRLGLPLTEAVGWLEVTVLERESVMVAV